MRLAFWFLLFLYVGLTLLYYSVARPDTPPIEPWPLLTPSGQREPVDPATARLFSVCRSHADCPLTHVCLNARCVPKLPGVRACDPATGRWTPHVHQGASFAACECLQPLLFDQKHFGGNCDVNLACGLNGHYYFPSQGCRCDPGFVAQGLACRKMFIVESLRYHPCEDDEWPVSELKPGHGFHPDYVRQLNAWGVRCVRKPCLFDASSGRALRHARFVEGWGCVCDPAYGLFGVVLERSTGADAHYLNAPGYDACASLFTENLQHPIHVRHVTYFYLGQREPASLLLFDNLQKKELVPPLKGSTHVLLGQKRWKYDYAQHVFRSRLPIAARTRSAKVLKWLFFTERLKEFVYVYPFQPPPCHKIPDYMGEDVGSERAGAYALLYKSPVCRIEPNDRLSDPLFWDRVVLNPQHLTFKEHWHLHRSNAFVLEYDPRPGYGRWTVDLEEAYKLDLYRDMDTNVPLYHAVFPRDVGPFHPYSYH